jgi:flagellar basal body rod protein FlgG
VGQNDDGCGARVIDPATSAGLARIAARERDVMHVYDSGFIPEANDIARKGTVVPSVDPLCVAIPEGAFVVTPHPNGSLAYARDGALTIVDGELRAHDGGAVLGFGIVDRSRLVPLRVDPYDSAQGRVANARIEADGTFAYARTTIDPRSGERRSENVTVGRIALARFPAGTQPTRIDARHVAPPAGVRPEFGLPGDGGFAKLVTRSRDLGRVDIVASLEKMREAYVSFEALRAAHHVRGGIEKTAMDLVK